MDGDRHLPLGRTRGPSDVSGPSLRELREIVDRLRAGELDDQLIYRKGLRRSLASYVTSTPPHVVAARKLPGAPPRIVSYLMTTAGPEPVEAQVHEPDREHYLEKQILPVAEPVEPERDSVE